MTGELDVEDGILHGDDALVFGEPGQGVDLDPGAGPARDVVQHHRQTDIGDRAEMDHQAGLIGLVVIGGHRQHPGTTEFGRSSGELNRFRCVVGTGPGDHMGVLAGHRIDDRLVESQLLDAAEGWRLTGGPGDDESVAPVVGEEAGETPCLLVIDVTRDSERGDHGRGHIAERRGQE